MGNLHQPFQILMLAATLAACGCSSTPDASRSDAAPSTGLDALDQDSASANLDLNDRSAGVTNQRLDLIAQALANGNVDVNAPARPRPAPSTPTTPIAADLTSEATPSDSEAESKAAAIANATAAIEHDPQDAPDQPPADAQSALVAELASMLRASAKDSADPTQALVQLAALELLASPSGALDATPDAATLKRLSPRERAFITKWRELFAGARSKMAGTSDVADLARRVSALASSMDDFESLSIPRTALARRVDGFGMFADMPTSSTGAYQFIAGRPNRMLVYAEIAGHTFTEKSQGGVEGFQVLLSQDLRLYHSSKDQDLLAWQQPAGDITDFSRNRRRDFYVIQEITLPRTLSVGSYRLKVRVTDRSSQASAEAIIPVDIVADASAMAGER